MALAACSDATAAPASAADPTFRLSAGPLPCNAGWDARSNGNKCAQRDFLVVAYPPTSADPTMSVTRYNGDHAGAPPAWTRRLDMAGDPVTVLAAKSAIVATVGKDTVELAALDAADGKVLARRSVPSAGAARVLLEAPRDSARAGTYLHVLAADGRGWTVTIDPATLALSAPRDIPARAIRTAMDRTAMPADGAAKAGAFEAGWDDADLVVRRAGGWTTVVVADERFRLQHVTLHAGNGRVYLTTHHAIASGAVAYAFDATTGKELWRRHLTGIGPVAHSKYYNKLSSFLDGDILVVQGVEAAGNYICTVSAADGAELACVDHLPASAVFDPPPAKVDTSPLPPEQPIGPTVSKQACVKSSAPRTSFAAVPGTGTTTGKRPKPITWIEGTLVFPSASCKPNLGGGIAGERVTLEVYDLSDRPGAPVCECTFEYRTATNKDSKVVSARVRGGVEIGKLDLRP
ncbi:MAG: PQQ-binding-like beta-propeller repeat protein [Deltaproteobacteria bacterium]|nr:PQQ-binding-like beta-propeller repeat protein [Deltaproteobacteria bacterium]